MYDLQFLKYVIIIPNLFIFIIVNFASIIVQLILILNIKKSLFYNKRSGINLA